MGPFLTRRFWFMSRTTGVKEEESVGRRLVFWGSTLGVEESERMGRRSLTTHAPGIETAMQLLHAFQLHLFLDFCFVSRSSQTTFTACRENLTYRQTPVLLLFLFLPNRQHLLTTWQTRTPFSSPSNGLSWSLTSFLLSTSVSSFWNTCSTLTVRDSLSHSCSIVSLVSWSVSWEPMRVSLSSSSGEPF